MKCEKYQNLYLMLIDRSKWQESCLSGNHIGLGLLTQFEKSECTHSPRTDSWALFLQDLQKHSTQTKILQNCTPNWHLCWIANVAVAATWVTNAINLRIMSKQVQFSGINRSFVMWHKIYTCLLPHAQHSSKKTIIKNDHISSEILFSTMNFYRYYLLCAATSCFLHFLLYYLLHSEHALFQWYHLFYMGHFEISNTMVVHLQINNT